MAALRPLPQMPTSDSVSAFVASETPYYLFLSPVGVPQTSTESLCVLGSAGRQSGYSSEQKGTAHAFMELMVRSVPQSLVSLHEVIFHLALPSQGKGSSLWGYRPYTWQAPWPTPQAFQEALGTANSPCARRGLHEEGGHGRVGASVCTGLGHRLFWGRQHGCHRKPPERLKPCSEPRGAHPRLSLSEATGLHPPWPAWSLPQVGGLHTFFPAARFRGFAVEESPSLVRGWGRLKLFNSLGFHSPGGLVMGPWLACGAFSSLALVRSCSLGRPCGAFPLKAEG